MEIDARFRYYFQHPWSRLIVAYLVTFFNFLIFAEDPISHSQTEAHMIVVGNCFSFLFNKYPGREWNALKTTLEYPLSDVFRRVMSENGLKVTLQDKSIIH
ncbi:hypothetical protein F2P81_006527 [Scophthalmus maximus]|uniref:Uncharacterized protein n=1 Tax=Scophthalmus maximus TaxID=52904 RepID=A0A6A4T6X2_SCOMX|nr:hypothetical protein F2P81_006527 [Scophthalmus maximus]